MNLVEETGTLSTGKRPIGAGPKRKLSLHEIQSLPRLRRGSIRPKIANPSFLLHAPDKTESGPLVLSIEGQVEEVFVVSQLDVVARTMALDQCVLQQERLFFRRRYHNLDVDGAPQH